MAVQFSSYLLACTSFTNALSFLFIFLIRVGSTYLLFREQLFHSVYFHLVSSLTYAFYYFMYSRMVIIYSMCHAAQVYPNTPAIERCLFLLSFAIFASSSSPFILLIFPCLLLAELAPLSSVCWMFCSPNPYLVIGMCYALCHFWRVCLGVCSTFLPLFKKFRVSL